MKWILVMETDDNDYRYMERIISRLGYRPYRAVSASQGHRFITESSPDVLLYGENISDSDPGSFCDWLRKNPQTADIPALLVSSRKDLAFRNEVRKYGFEDIVYRPISIRNFFEKLELCLSNNRRSQIRAPMCFPVNVLSSYESRILETFNFGEGGIYLQTEEPVPRKTNLDLQFKLPGFDNLIYLKGKVIHSQSDGSDEIPAGMGIQFTNLAGSLKAMLCIYMENYLAITTPLVTTQGRLWCAENGDVRPGYQIG